jgi:hypothetical protein
MSHRKLNDLSKMVAVLGAIWLFGAVAVLSTCAGG